MRSKMRRMKGDSTCSIPRGCCTMSSDMLNYHNLERGSGIWRIEARKLINSIQRATPEKINILPKISLFVQLQVIRKATKSLRLPSVSLGVHPRACGAGIPFRKNSGWCDSIGPRCFSLQELLQGSRSSKAHPCHPHLPDPQLVCPRHACRASAPVMESATESSRTLHGKPEEDQVGILQAKQQEIAKMGQGQGYWAWSRHWECEDSLR